MKRILLRLIADNALIATMLFVSAWTLAWPRAWVLLLVMLVIRTVTAFAVHRVNPALMEERAKPPIHRDQPSTDKRLLLGVIFTGFIVLPLLVGLDVFHWQVLPKPGLTLSSLGLLLFVAGWGLQGIALHTNAFAASVVRLQQERKHVVVDTGPYRVVRHPFYTGTPLVLIGMALWLESLAAALFAIVPLAFVVMRLRNEENFLRRELPGYSEYAARVRYRLVPGIW